MTAERSDENAGEGGSPVIVVGGLGAVEVLFFKDRFFFDARTDAFDLTFGVENASFLKFVSQK